MQLGRKDWIHHLEKVNLSLHSTSSWHRSRSELLWSMDGTIHSSMHSSLLASLRLARGERLRLGSGIMHTTTQDRDRLPALLAKGGVGCVFWLCWHPVSAGQEGGSLSRWIQYPVEERSYTKFTTNSYVLLGPQSPKLISHSKASGGVLLISFYLVWHFLFLVGWSTFPEKLQILIFIPSFRRG